MKVIDFYKFIYENKIEYHWHTNDTSKERDVIFFISYSQIDDFANLLTSFDFDDEGIICYMKDGYFAFWAFDILESHGIELNEIFGRDAKGE